jgi:hypothetical protein
MIEGNRDELRRTVGSIIILAWTFAFAAITIWFAMM